MATRPTSLHDFFIGRSLQTQSDVAYSNILGDDDPNRSRQANVVGRDIGLPGATVAADLNGFEQEAYNNKALDILHNDPHIASFLGEPHTAASVKDDLPSLATISSLLGTGPKKRDWSFRAAAKPDFSRFNNAPGVATLVSGHTPEPIPATPGNVARGLGASIVGGTAEGILGGIEALADNLGLGEKFKSTDFYTRNARQAYLDQQAANNLDFKPVGKIAGVDINPQQWAFSAATSIGQLGLAVMTGNPIAGFGLIAGGQFYRQARQRGASVKQATGSALAYGGIEAGTEAIEIPYLLNQFGKKGTGKFIAGLLGREIPGELVATAGENLVDAMTTGGVGWNQYKANLPADLLNTAASTALTVGAMGAGSFVRRRLGPEVNAIDDIERAHAGGEFLDNLMAAAEQSKVKAEDPETLKDFIDQRTQDSPVRNVYVPVEAAVAYMQSENYGGELNRYQEQIAQAQQTQGDVVIPISDAVAHLSGTPAWDALKEEVRVEPGGLSRKEATKQHAEILDQLEQRGKEIATEAQDNEGQLDSAGEVYTEVKNRLRLAGVDDRQADAVAQIYAARYEARAARRGGTAMEQFKASNISFPGEQGGRPAGREVAQDQGSVVNIGLDIPGGGSVDIDEALRTLKAQGVDVLDTQVRQSGTEPTLIARLSKPLTAKQGHAVSEALKQEAIAQRAGDKGDLFGPSAEKWGPFNPDYFLDFDRTLNQDAALLGWQGVSQYLTDEEKANLREASKAKIVGLVESLAHAHEVAAAAAAGRAKRGWYENSAKAILDVFGPADAPRFAALLAALSPQTSVESNLYNALATWTLWNQEGRPKERRAIVEILGRSVQGGKGVGSVLTAWINNSITALATDDVTKIKLSGPKVNSFMNNLVGDVDEVTNDTWMANFFGVDPTFVRPLAGGKSPGYKAMNAVVRRAAEILSQKTGETWTPAEVQETVWSLAKTTYEKRNSAGETRNMKELLKLGHVTHADIANTVDFAVLFTHGVFRTILEQGGYGEQIAALESGRRSTDVPGETPVSEAEGTGFNQRTLERYLTSIAGRLEEVRARRQAQSRTLNQDVLPEAGWTPERVSGLIDQFGNEDGSSTAIAVMMSPDEYLAMNASAAGREMIAKRVAEIEDYGGALDVQRLQDSPPIYLGVALGGPNNNRPPPMVRGHDGRHRMELLRQAGIARVPVIVSLTDKDGKPHPVTEPIQISNIVPNRSRSSQMETGDLVGELEGVPISWKYQDQLAAMGQRVVFQGPRGSTTFTDDGAKLIQLFSTADRSTLLHETGHIWLEELKADASAADATAQDKADWETVKKWFAAQGVAVKGDFIPTEAHEFWARGVERYFMEGKSPSVKLAGVFRTFKSWLLKIYGVVQNLNTPITPEVREVMDRLIATQDAIDDARRLNATEPLFKTAEDAGMTDAEFADYQERIANARDEAYDALLFKTMEKIRRERTEEMRSQKANIRGEVAEHVNKQPQFRLLHLLRTGKWLGEPDRPAQPVKLNTGWLIDNYGEDILNKLPRGIQIWAGNGETGDVVAEMVGLGSGAEVVQTLVGMRAASDELRRTGETRSMRDKLIAEETDRIMAERHGDVLTDGSIEEEAVAAINSARQGEIIAAEARQLSKRKHVLGVPTPYQFAREWAKRTVAAGLVRDVASRAALQRYIRNTNKAARAAEEAILKGDVDEAYRQKQAQLLNHALLAEAKAAADRMDKIIARMRRLAGRAAMKSVDPAYMERVHQLLEDYDFRPRSQRSIDEQEDFQAWLERQRAKGFEVHIPPRLENNGTPYSRVPVQELDSLNDLVESLIAVGRTKQKIKIAQKERDFAEYRDNVVARIKALPDRKLPAKPINEEERKLAAAASELLKVETIAEELDGGPTGPLHDVLVLGATNAENLRHTLREKVLLPLANMYNKLGRKYWRHLQERVTIPELTWNTLNEGDPRQGTPVTITRSELLAIFMNMGNLSNLEKLSKGERWPVETLRAVMERELTKEDYDFAQQMWDTVEQLWPDIVNVEREMSGVVPEKVVNAPISTPYGTYEGGYWPVVYDAARWQVAEDLEGKEVDDMFGMKSGVATQKGHTVSRTAAFGPINLSLERVLFRHIEQVVTRIAYAPYARDVLRTVRDKTIRGWMDTKLGPEYRKQIEPWLARQIHQGHPFPKGARWWDRTLRQFRINMTIAAMGFRISTGTAQVLGLTASAQRIGSKWVGVGMKRLAAHPREAARFAYAKSPELYHRTEAVNREVAEVANRMRQKHKWWSSAQHWAMWHIGMVDRYMVALPTWLGAYEKAREPMGLSDEQAVAYADKSVRMSQGTGREKDMAAVQSPNSEAMRFFTMFYTPFNVMFNAQWQGARGVKRGDPRPLIAVTWWWLMMSTLGDALMSGDWPDDWLDFNMKPDDDEGLIGSSVEGWFMRNVFFGMFTGIPVARDFANWGERKITGQYTTEPGNTPITRVADAINQAWDAGKRKATKGENPERPIKEAGDLTAILFGVPTSQIGATGQFAWDVHEGKQDPQSVSDWYFGITKGKVPEKKGEDGP